MRGKTNKLHDVFRFIDMKSPDLLGRVGKDACWPWLGAYTDKDLPSFQCQRRRYNAYRVVCHLTDPTFDLDNPEDFVRHKCDNKGVKKKQRCCNPSHLTHGTHQENMDDMVARERHGLSAHTLRYIMNLLTAFNADGSPTFTHDEIADRFGVSRQLITAINIGDRHAKKVKGNFTLEHTQGRIARVIPTPRKDGDDE